MGLFNTHGMADDEKLVEESIDFLGITSEEMMQMVEYNRGEAWVWDQMAKSSKGQRKRRANLFVKHFNLRMQKWIDLAAKTEMEYEHRSGIFSEEKNAATG